jgi:ribosomal protein S18 acetylase RimI-like enzyme
MASRPHDHVSVRPATTGDIDFLAQVVLLANVERYQKAADWNAAVFLAEARARTADEVDGNVDDSTTYVIEADGERVGRLRIVRTGERLEIAGIQVLPAYQRRGIGTLVITSHMHEGKTRGVPVVLEVEKDNPDARRLYLRLGFVQRDDRGDRFLMIVPDE